MTGGSARRVSGELGVHPLLLPHRAPDVVVRRAGERRGAHPGPQPGVPGEGEQRVGQRLGPAGANEQALDAVRDLLGEAPCLLYTSDAADEG